MAHWKTLYGADIFDLDYDALVREPRPAIERLTRFCGLEWEEACLSFEQAARAVKTASVWQVREPSVSALLGPLAQLRRANRAAAGVSAEGWSRNRRLGTG